jgi:phasin family protein
MVSSIVQAVRASRIGAAQQKACNPGSGLYTSLHVAVQHLRSGRQEVVPRSSFSTILFGDLTMLTAEQVIAAHKSNIEVLFGLTNKAFEGVEKLVELNLQVARAAIGEAAENTKAVMSAKDAKEFLALQSSLLQPAAEKAAAYSRHLYDIATATTADIGKVAEAQASEAQAKFMTAVDSAVKNAPAGSENAVALVKSAVAAANNAFEGVQKAVKQATDVAEANFQAMSAQATKATKVAKRAA